MEKIKKISIEQADKFMLKNKLWGCDGYMASVCAQIAYNDEGFIVRFTVGESNPLREKKQHLELVHEDSCVEFFANFLPEKTDNYINFEVNAAGAMNVAFRSNRKDGVPLMLEEIESFCIMPEIKDDYWRVTYKVGYDFIKKYYPEFDINSCDYIKGNFYKCGDKTEIEHYLSYFKVETELPDFHRPKFFGKIGVEKESQETSYK